MKILSLKVLLSVFIFFSLFLFGFSAEAASFSIAPAQGNYYLGENITVRVELDSPTQAANAVSGVITFPVDKLQVVSLTKGATIDFWVEQPTFSNTQGTIRFEGITFNPGFSGYGGRILTIVFKGRTTGEASMNFLSGSILANDGEGSDITQVKQGASLTLLPARPKPPEPPGDLIIVTSPTHPESSRWYSNREPRFNLTFPSSTTAVSVLLDINATTSPPTTTKELVTTYDSPSLSDGVWYLHTRGKTPTGWSSPGHFGVRIDTKAPEPFTISLSNGSGATNFYSSEVVFGTTDTLSGMERYEVFVNNQKISTLTASSGESYQRVQLPYQAWGTRIVRVVAFDQAGNKTESIAEFVVSLSIWLFIIVALLLLFIAVLIWFFVFTWQAKRKLKENIHKQLHDLLPERVDLDFVKQSESVNRDVEGLYIDLRNLLALKSQHKAFFYLKEARARKLTNEQISQELRSAGWSDEEILSLIWEERSIQSISEKIKKNLDDLQG